MCRERGEAVPVLEEQPEMKHLLSLYYRLDKPSDFLIWKGAYDPEKEGVAFLTTNFRIKTDITTLGMDSFFVTELTAKTAATLSGYAEPPCLFEYLGRLMVFNGMEPCSVNHIEALISTKNISAR